MSADIDVDAAHDDIMYPSAVPFVLVHLGCIGTIWSGVTWRAIAICVTLYGLRMFAIRAGYHGQWVRCEGYCCDVHGPKRSCGQTDAIRAYAAALDGVTTLKQAPPYPGPRPT